MHASPPEVLSGANPSPAVQLPTCMHSDPATTAGFGWIQDSVESCIQCGYSWIQDTAGYAAFSCVRVQLRSAWIQVCVQLRSGTCVQLRSAFGCVLRSAAFRNLRSAAFCVQLRSAWIQPGVIQSFWVGILCGQGRYASTHTYCNPSLAARNVNTQSFLPGPSRVEIEPIKAL